MLTAEVFNWTGHVLRLPRTQLSEGLKRPEATQTGVYILMGQDDDGPIAYIGETECMSERLKTHAHKLDWWDEAVLVTAAGDPLHKAHVKYLESRLVELAKDAGRMRLANANIPPRASLNEAAISNMESFLDTLGMVLPAIRVDFLQTGKRSSHSEPAPPTTMKNQSVFILEMKRYGIEARAELCEGEWIVLQGTQARIDPVSKSSYTNLHHELLKNGTLVPSGDQACFTSDFAFSSPSAAAAVVKGRSTNGRTSWKLPDGRTYADWEAEQLKATDT
jgi:hypothetical protein